MGKSEVVQEELNPDFKKSFILDYFFESPQNMLLKVWDSDELGSRGGDEDRINDPLGELQFQLGAVVGARGNVLRKFMNLRGR